jgi:hypothetical protein
VTRGELLTALSPDLAQTYIVPNLDGLTRAEQAAALRTAGASWRTIADQLDYYDEHTAQRAAQRAMARTIGPRGYEQAAWYQRMLDLYAVVSRYAGDGSAAHARVCVQIAARVSTLLGLDEPSTHLVGKLDEARAPYGGMEALAWIRSGGEVSDADLEVWRITRPELDALRRGWSDETGRDQ